MDEALFPPVSLPGIMPPLLLDLPIELLENILHVHVHGKSEPVERVGSIATLAILSGACKLFRAVLAHDAAKLLAQLGVSSFETAAIALALKQAELPDGGNRIGFEFASVGLAAEDGRGSDVPGSRSRIAVYASVLRRHPRACATVHAHCGPTAPRGIAMQYSIQRGELVMSELAQHGVASSRLAVAVSRSGARTVDYQRCT